MRNPKKFIIQSIERDIESIIEIGGQTNKRTAMNKAALLLFEKQMQIEKGCYLLERTNLGNNKILFTIYFKDGSSYYATYNKNKKSLLNALRA